MHVVVAMQKGGCWDQRYKAINTLSTFNTWHLEQLFEIRFSIDLQNTKP